MGRTSEPVWISARSDEPITQTPSSRLTHSIPINNSSGSSLSSVPLKRKRLALSYFISTAR